MILSPPHPILSYTILPFPSLAAMLHLSTLPCESFLLFNLYLEKINLKKEEINQAQLLFKKNPLKY